MPTHRFRCPSCSKSLKVDDALLAEIRRKGKGTHCPTCKAPVSVEGLPQSPENVPLPAKWEPFLSKPSGLAPRPDNDLDQSQNLSASDSMLPAPPPSPPANETVLDEPALTGSTKKCPFCAEPIQATAAKCRFCGEFLTGQRGSTQDGSLGPPPHSSWVTELGMLLLSGGFVGLVYFFFVMDTTVPLNPLLYDHGVDMRRITPLPMMYQQLLGVLVSLAATILGIVLCVLGSRR